MGSCSMRSTLFPPGGVTRGDGGRLVVVAASVAVPETGLCASRCPWFTGIVEGGVLSSVLLKAVDSKTAASSRCTSAAAEDTAVP